MIKTLSGDASYGIDSDATATISGNIVIVAEYGIYVNGNNNAVTGNYVTGCVNGIFIVTATTCNVNCGNRSTGNSTANYTDNGTATVSIGNLYT